MKKNVVRILALVLVGLMVLSLLPLVTYGDWCEHSYETVQVDPYCGEDGYTAAVCQKCGEMVGMEIIPHTEEHDFSACVVSDDYLISEGDCLEPSLYYKSCSKCGMIAEFAYQQALEQMQQSLWDQYNREVAYYGAPVSDWGLKIQQATEDIQNTYTFKVGGDGHHFYEVEGQEATCTSDGWTPYRVCEVCGEIEGYETIPAKGHRFGEWVVTKEPTCTEDGVKERVCEVCGEKETEAVPALGHQGKFTTIKAPTCTEPGSEKRICTVCQTEEIREIPALGHKGPFVVTKEATCTEPGEQERVCEVCGAKETAPVPAAHKYGEDNLCVFCGAENPDRPAVSDTETFGSGGDENGDSANLENTPDAQPEEQGEEMNAKEPAVEEEVVDEGNKNEDNETFEAGQINSVKIKLGSVEVSEAKVGDTLTVVAEPSALEYTYSWYRITQEGADPTMISNANESTYTLTESDCPYQINCSVYAGTNPANAKSADNSVHVRMDVPFPVVRKGTGTIETTNEDKPNHTDPVSATDPAEINALTENGVTFTATPGNGAVIRYVKLGTNEDSATTVIPASVEARTYTINSVTTSQKNYRFFVYFDTYEVNIDPDKAMLKTDVQSDKNPDIKQSFIDAYVKAGDEYTYYYVTPCWLGDPATPISDADLSVLGSFDFSLLMPEAVTPEKYNETKKDFDIQVFHYVKNTDTWEIVPFTIGTRVVNGVTRLTVEIKNYSNFSPFAVLAKPSRSLSFAPGEEGEGSMGTITKANGETVTVPEPTFTAKEEGWTLEDPYCWKDGSGKQYKPGDTIKLEADTVLTAQWMEGYTVTFEKNESGTYGALVTGDMSPMHVKKGETKALTPNAYSLKNYSFIGWSLTAGDGNTVDYTDGEGIKPEGNVKLYAVWEKTYCTITYNPGDYGSGTMNDQTALAGNSVTLKPNAYTSTMESKMFAGWSTKKNGNVEYKDQETIDELSGNLTLYAIWKDKILVRYHPECIVKIGENSVNVTGTGTMADQIVPAGEKFTLTKNGFNAPNQYSFGGWNTKKDGSGTAYTDGQEVTLTGDTSLYAQWGRTAYTVTYMGNGGTGSMSTQTIPANGAVAISQNGFTAPYGKTFVGWSTEPGVDNEAEARYAPGKPLKANEMKEDLTLYAVWKDIITLHFDKNNENAGGTMADQQFIKGEAAKLNAVSFQAPTDYAFKYWTKTAADPYPDKFADEVTTNDVYRDKAEITVDADATLYAQWERSAYNVSFDKNSSGASGAMASQKFTRNTAAALNANKFTAPTGFAFKYWTETKDDPYPDTSASLVTATDVYKDKAEVNGEGNRLTEDKTLYAQWERVSYSVIYNANGGTGSMSAQTVMKDGAVSVSENKFTAPAGKIFIGWSKTPGQANTVDYEVGATVRWEDLNKEPFTDLTIYAVWKDKIIIHFDRESDSGTGSGTMADQEAPKGEKITLNANKFTAPSGMAFKEWNIRKDGTGTATYTDAQKDVVFEEDTTLYAQWLEDACTITFDKNDHEPPCETKNQSALKGVATKLDANSFETPAGKAFTGWNTKRDGSGTAFKDQATVKVSKDITLYAQWINASTITFDKNAADATGTMEPQVVESGVSTALTANSFKRVNYQFEGWTTKADGSGDKYADKGNISTMSDTTLYAVWKQIAYAITYDPNGGGGDQMAQQNVAIGNTATIRECAYNPKPGEVFAYWQEIKNYEQNYAPAGSSEHSDIYYPGEKITPTRDLALKAVWVDELVLSYYPGEGSGIYNEGEVPKGVPTNVKTAAEAKFTAPANSTFAYWQDESGNKYYEDNQYIFNQNTKLTAIWAPSCTITYNKNASDVTGTMSAQTAPSGVEVALHDNKFSRSEYIFKYWTKTKSDPYPNKKPDEVSSTDVYKDGANITVTQDTNLYAQWYKTAITKGAVAVTGELTGLDDFAVWGETLTAVVNDPVLKSGFTYTWQVDGNIVKSGPDNTYLVQKEDYGKTIVCAVSHPQATNEVESNTKIVGTYAESDDLMIINNGNDSYPYSKYAYVYGVVPGTTFYKDGKAYLVPESAVDGYMEIGIPGTYTFGHATYYIENWYTVGYEVDTSGGGTVTMKNGTTTLTSSTKTSDIQHLVNTVWLVRDGSATDINITMKPASSTYVHWAVNGGKYSSSSAEVSRRLGTINQPMLFEIVFNKSSSSPKTGDMSQLGLWSALCFSSLVGAAGMIGGTRKRRKSR